MLKMFVAVMTSLKTLSGQAIISLLLTVVSFTSQAHASQLEKQLFSVLMQGYSRHIRPVKNPHDAVKVSLTFSLVEVLDVDEDDGQLSVKAWLSMSWVDEYLKWRPEHNGGIKRLNFPTDGSNRIWLPDIFVLNAMRTHLDPNIQVVVYFDGNVRWVQPAVYVVRVRHEFRGNWWVAAFNVGSWTYDESMLDIQPPTPVRRQQPSIRHEGLGNVYLQTDQDKSTAGSDESTYSASSSSSTVPGDVDVDIDTESFATNDQWSLLDHAGRRESRVPHPCCAQDYVTLRYEVKLRKKLGPSLLG